MSPETSGGDLDIVGPTQWDAISLWLRQHPRGPELLDALAAAAGNLPAAVAAQLAAMAQLPDAPPTLVTVVTGGYVDKLVQVARAETVNILLSASDVPVPAQLPAVPPDFVNRVAELNRLRGVLHEHNEAVVIAVASKGGTGKSTLAIRFAAEVAPRFPDAQLYVDLRGADGDAAVDPSEVLDRFLQAMGVPAERIPGTSADRQALYRSLLARRRALIVLDNAADERQVRPLLPGGTSCLVIITSRRSLAGLSVSAEIILDTLSPVDSVLLLGQLAGAARVAAERQDAELVARYCGYLPLALHIAGARLRSRPRWRVADLAARLADERYRLDELHAGDLDARTSFELSYRELNPAQAHAFRLLSVAPGLDFGIPAAAALLHTSERGAASVLEALVDMALLETPVTGRYRFHDLIRLFAREHMANDPNSWDAALDRVLTFYRNAAKGWFERALGEFQPHPDAVPWFDAEGGNVLDAAEAACSRGAWTVVIDLAATLHHLLSLRGRAAELERLLFLAVSAAERAGNVDAEVHATIRLAELMLWHGRAAETPELYEKCLRLTSQADDPARRAWILTHNGDALRDLGEPGRARAAYEEALRINESRGDAVGQGWVLTHLGGALRDLGELGDAESAYRRALVIADQGGDVGARVWTLTHMCWTLADLSRWDDAVDALGTALAFHQSTGDLIGQEGDLQSLGKLHAAHATADAARASDHYRAAVDSYRKAADIAAQRHDMFAVDQWTRTANRSVAAGEAG